jgi:hypothetical protein
MKTEVITFTKNNIEAKKKHALAVFLLLEKSYKFCGGIQLGNGFQNPEDMVKNIPVWRLSFKGDKLISVMMFKQKFCKLKMVAYAPFSDIDPAIRKSDLSYMLNNSYAELSGKLLSITLKEIKSDWQKYVVKTPEKVLKKELIPLSKYLETEKLPFNSEGMYRKLNREYPELLQYCYLRKIGNEFKLKLLFAPKLLPMR